MNRFIIISMKNIFATIFICKTIFHLIRTSRYINTIRLSIIKVPHWRRSILLFFFFLFSPFVFTVFVRSRSSFSLKSFVQEGDLVKIAVLKEEERKEENLSYIIPLLVVFEQSNSLDSIPFYSICFLFSFVFYCLSKRKERCRQAFRYFINCLSCDSINIIPNG